MIKTELKVETIGKPSVQELPEIERRTFFETLYARIKELKENQEVSTTDKENDFVFRPAERKRNCTSLQG